MNKPFSLWSIAVVITIFIAVFQRITGPTYPLSGNSMLDSKEIKFKFHRSHAGFSDHIVEVETEDENIDGILFWKRYKVEEDWLEIKMTKRTGLLSASLPNQPPAGKLVYYAVLHSENQEIMLPSEEKVVIRFRGDVPAVILVTHVIAMFGAMLLSTRTGLEFFSREPKLNRLTIWTLGFLFIGGLILGPVVQKYAFDAYWTGFPFGHDLTDNKTAIAFIGWLCAFLMYKKTKQPKRWALFAAVLLLVVYLIPHSVLGSELDYSELDKSNSIINSQIQDK